MRTALNGVIVQMQMQALVSGQSADADGGSGQAGDPVTALLARVVEAADGRVHKLELHQLARELGVDRETLASLYTGRPPLLVADLGDRVITTEGRERAASA